MKLTTPLKNRTPDLQRLLRHETLWRRQRRRRVGQVRPPRPRGEAAAEPGEEALPRNLDRIVTL